MRHVAVLGERRFKMLDLCPEREPTRGDQSCERIVQLVVDARMLAPETDKPNFRCPGGALRLVCKKSSPSCPIVACGKTVRQLCGGANRTRCPSAVQRDERNKRALVAVVHFAMRPVLE